jgi:hypothetical protein
MLFAVGKVEESAEPRIELLTLIELRTGVSVVAERHETLALIEEHLGGCGICRMRPGARENEERSGCEGGGKAH